MTAPAILIGGVTVGVCLASLWSISRLQANLNSILVENVASLEAAADLEVKLRHLRFHTFLYVMDPTPARARTIGDAEAGFEAALAAARRSARPDDVELVAAIEVGYRRYRSDRPGPADLAETAWSRRAYLDWADAHPVQPLLDQCQELMDRNRTAMEATARESERVGDRTRAAMAALAILGPLGGLVAGFGIARGLSRSIARLRVRVEDVRAELAQDVATVRVEGDGLRGLDAGLDEVVVRVRDVVEQAQRREREGLRAEQLAAVGQLAAGVAHEVRNPLMAVKLLVESALAGGDLTGNDLRVIHGEIGRLEQTVTGLLDFARPGALRREVTNVSGVAAAAVELVAGRAALQKVRVELDTPADPVPANVDAAQLKGVLVNLLLNALDALPGGGRVSVAVAAGDAGGVRLTVTDTGPGIAPAILGKLFEPFASTKDTGTGLGLNVCRRVVRDHGGEIRGENRPGGGAAFTIDLPGGPSCQNSS